MASLNNLYKIDAGVFGAWMQVLVQVSLWRMDAGVGGGKSLAHGCKCKSLGMDAGVGAGNPLPGYT
jgi:hypothetical protein